MCENQEESTKMIDLINFVPKHDRYRCGIDDCEYHGMSYDLRNHLTKEHNVRNAFNCHHCDIKLYPEIGQKNVSIPFILNHLELHGNDIYSCKHCDRLFSSEFEIQLHIVRQHLLCEFRYQHRNIRNKIDGNGQAVTVDDINILFECNICQQGVPTVAMTSEHYKTVHFGANIDFTAIQFTTRTMANFEKISIPPHNAFMLQQRLICALCDTTISTKEKLLAHHKEKHSNEFPMIRFSPLMCFNQMDKPNLMDLTKANAKFDRHIFYACVYCDENSSYFSSMKGVHMHWNSCHSEDLEPFRVQAVPLVACIHCQAISTFRGLLHHHEYQHLNQPFVAVHPMNSQQCTLCKYIGNDIIQHFTLKHFNVIQENNSNPVCLSEDTLNQLLDIQVMIKFKCTHCDDIFDMENECRAHHLEMHENLDYIQLKFYDNQSVQLIGNCCQQEINQITFFEHLAEHKQTLCCPKCTYHTENSFKFMNHSIDLHQMHHDACSIDLKYLNTQFWNSQYVFGNGLVLNKYNLVETSIDDSKRFNEFAKSIVTQRETDFYEKY